MGTGGVSGNKSVLRRMDAVLDTRTMLDEARITERRAALASAAGQAFYDTLRFSFTHPGVPNSLRLEEQLDRAVGRHEFLLLDQRTGFSR